MGNSIKFGLMGFAIGAALIGMQAARAVQAAPLAQLAPGEWQLKEIGGTDVRSVCAADPGALLQVQQPGQACARTVVDSAGRSLTVHYSCGGRGHGRSVLTVHTPRSIRLETQGIATGMPFNTDYDGRFVGPCGRSS